MADPADTGMRYSVAAKAPPPSEQGGALYLPPPEAQPPEAQPPQEQGGALYLPPSVPAQDNQAAARMAGYEWSDIHDFTADRTEAAAQAGYAPREIDSYLGWPDPKPFLDRTDAQWMARLTDAPEIADVLKAPAGDMSPQQHDAIAGDWLKDDYVRALVDGHVKGADDFAQQYVGSLAAQLGDEDTGEVPPEMKERAFFVARQVAATLPSHDNATDFAIGLTHANDVPVTPTTIANTKRNLLDGWISTGDPFLDYVARVNQDPAVGDDLTRARYLPAEHNELADVWQAIKDRESEIWSAPLAGNNPDWATFQKYFGAPNTPVGLLNHVLGVAAFGTAAGIDASMRLPQSVLWGAIGGAEGLLRPVLGQDFNLDGLIREVIMPGMAMEMGQGLTGRGSPMTVKTIDPLKSAAEAEQTVPAAQAYTPDAALHAAARDEIENPGSAQKAAANAEPGAAPPQDPKQVEELAQGYDAATAIWGKLGETLDMHAGISLPHAWRGLVSAFRTTQQQFDAAAAAAAADFMKGNIRRYRGMADRQMAAHFNTLEQYRSVINKHMPEYARWVRMGVTRPAQKPLIANLIDYVEGRSAGVTLDPNSPFAPVADALRGIHEALRAEIEKFNPNMASFIEDYYAHLWTDQRAAARNFQAPLGVGKQGSGRSLQKRSIPTISEGLDQGLMPRILDPIENLLHYADGMTKFIAARKILEDSKTAGYVEYGTQSPLGWMPLKGAAAVLPAGENAIQRAYATPGAAAPYNNWLGRGFYDVQIGSSLGLRNAAGSLYNGLQYVSNTMTAMKLAWSGYHAVNIARETAIANLATGIGKIARGDLIAGLKDMGYGVAMLPGIVSYARAGGAIQKKYLDLGNTDPVVQLLTEAGFNPLGRSQRYSGISGMVSPDVQTAAHGASLMQMLRRGSLRWQLAEEARHIGGSAEEAGGYRAVMAGPRAAGFMINQIARAIDAINKPLFDVLIPKIKTGAAAAEMESWLRHNPLASRDEQLSVARKIVDSMDDRFGELNQDNLFWPRMIKQMLNLATVSVGWEYGTLRAYGGGASDIFHGDMNSTRARWMIAFPMQMAMINSLYQYISSGRPPQSTKDFALPQTGGTFSNRGGTVPERALLPGYEKDALQTHRSLALVPDFTRIPGNLANQIMSKRNPFWTAIGGTLSGQDGAGHYIYEQPNPPFQAWHMPPGFANWLRYMGKELTPIAAGSQMDLKPGTHVNRLQRLFGIQPAGSFFQNPKGAQEGLAAHERNVTKQAARRDMQENQQ